MSKNAQGHAKLAEILIEKEIIYANDLEAIFGKRQWVSRSQELFNQDQQTIQEFDRAESESASKEKKEIFIHENEESKKEEADSLNNDSLNNDSLNNDSLDKDEDKK